MKLKLAAIVMLVALLSGAAAALWFNDQISTAHAPPHAINVTIPKGASSAAIAHRLADNGVISSALLFRLLVRLDGSAASLRSGYYHFAEAADMKHVLERIKRGDVVRFQITVPEGLRTDEVLQLLADRSEIPVSVWQQALGRLIRGEAEGRLLPETYQYTRPIQPARLLGAMIRAQDKLLANLAADERARGDLRIIASIIEKETALEAERPLVSAVIRNRLQKGMPLQMDPTVIYGIWRRKGAFSGNIHRRDLVADTPWNSYTRKGLPPTPISNPGAASLRAAAAPADAGFLYFVADGSGGHAFATTIEEHRANVRRWLKIEKKKGGRRQSGWRRN